VGNNAFTTHENPRVRVVAFTISLSTDNAARPAAERRPRSAATNRQYTRDALRASEMRRGAQNGNGLFVAHAVK